MKSLNVGCGNDEECDERIDLYKTKTTTRVVNISEDKLPYEDETFDYIKARSILEHCRNPGHVIDECYRVLKKGGKIYVRVDYAGYLPMFLFKSHEHNAILDRQYDYKNFGHQQNEDRHYFLFVESHFNALFSKFSKREFTYISVGRNKIINFILRHLPFKFGAIHLDMIATK